MPLVSTLIVAGALNAALLSAVLAFAIRRDPKAAWLSLGVAILGVVTTAIFITHETDGLVEALAEAVEVVVTLAAGPTIYHYIRTAMGNPVDRRHSFGHFAPSLLAALASPLMVLQMAPSPPVELLCLHLAAYTALSAWHFLSQRTRTDRSAHGFWWPVATLVILAGVHGGQLARFTVAGAGDANIVALIGALGVFGLLAIALAVDRITARAASKYSRSALDAARLTVIYDRMVEACERDALHRRPDLSLADLAAAAEVPPHHASQALSEIGRTTFSELVASWRVADAKTLLAAPENRTVAVEPIGMEAGFRSRSAFYGAFRQVTGMTPAQYRRQLSEIVSAPSG